MSLARETSWIIYMQGGMKSAISADESTKPDDSRTVLFVPDTPIVSELWASGMGHYLELLPK